MRQLERDISAPRTGGGVKVALDSENALKRVLAPNKPDSKRATEPALECLLCEQRFSRQEIERGEYRLETMICSYCYARMQRAPYERCCFGKPTLIQLDGKRLYGYNPKAEECERICPDRVVCRLIVLGV